LVRQTTKVIVFEVLGVLSLMLMAAVGVLAFMLASGPVELGVFRDDVEQALTNARNGRAVTVDELTLQWSPADRRLFVVANGLSLKDENGEEAGVADRADLTLDAGAIFLGDMEVIQASLTGGWVELRNTVPNRWSIAGDPLPEIRAGVLPQTPQEWLDRINSVLGDVLTGADGFEQTNNLELLSFDEMDIRVLSQSGEPLASINEASGSIESIEGDLSLSLTGAGEGALLPEIFGLSIDTSGQFSELKANLDVGVLPISLLARSLGVPGLDESDLIAGTSFGATVLRDGGLDHVDLVLASQEGVVRIPGIDETISRLDAALSYRPSADEVVISRLGVESDRLQGTLSGRLVNVLSENKLRRIELASDSLDFDLTPMFESAWTLSDVAVSADVSDDFTVIAFDKAGFSVDDVEIRASGELDLSVDHKDGEIPLKLDLSTEAIGEFGKATVLKFWPVKLGDSGRRFVSQNLNAGIVTEASARLELKPDSMAQGFLRDEDLTVTFGFKGGDVRFMSDMPPATRAIGIGKLGGNSLCVAVTSAIYDDWNIQSADVKFPQLNPRGQDFFVTAIGSGPAISILRNLSESNLKLEENTGFDPERVSGDVRASLTLRRPALQNVAFEDVGLQVRGEIQNAGLKAAVGELDVSNGRVEVDLTEDRMILTGFGDLGSSPVQFTWRDSFDDDGAPADLSATAVITPDVLNTFGLIGRAFLTGEIPTEMQGQVGSGGLQKATFAFDLRDARIDVAEIGWIKPAGEAARATLTYTGDLREQASEIRLDSDKAKLDGSIRLASDGQLRELILRRLFLEDLADVSGDIKRDDTGGLLVTLGGAYLDVSSIISDIGAVGGASGEAGFDLTFDAQVERLKMRSNLDLTNAIISVTNTTKGLESFTAQGVSENGSTIDAFLKSNGPGQASDISLKASDAGFLAAAFFGADFITGGKLDLTGTLATETAPTKLMAKISDARLKNAPFFTQILSLASLRGLSDTLSGEGVLFSKIEAPITIGGGRYVVEGGRASGPALGLTVNGWIGADGKGIELDGVLVPSFGVNSVLGGVPIIGDLLVGREGEGIFSITYSVSGTLEKAQVAVNPLSAVTPGILRRIFENPSDTRIPKTLPVDPNLKPPGEKLPDLPDEEVISRTPDSDG
jgi:hypothetical protein